MLGGPVCRVCREQVSDGLHGLLVRGEANAEVAEVGALLVPLRVWAFPEASPRSKPLRRAHLAPFEVGPKVSLSDGVLRARGAMGRNTVATLTVITVNTVVEASGFTGVSVEGPRYAWGI